MGLGNEFKGNEDSGGRLKRFYNVQEAADYLGISKAAIYKYVGFGMLSSRRLSSIPTKQQSKVKVHGRIVFEIVDLDNFVEKFSEKREACFCNRKLEKSLDNVN